MERRFYKVPPKINLSWCITIMFTKFLGNYKYSYSQMDFKTSFPITRRPHKPRWVVQPKSISGFGDRTSNRELFDATAKKLVLGLVPGWWWWNHETRFIASPKEIDKNLDESLYLIVSCLSFFGFFWLGVAIAENGQISDKTCLGSTPEMMVNNGVIRNEWMLMDVTQKKQHRTTSRTRPF